MCRIERERAATMGIGATVRTGLSAHRPTGSRHSPISDQVARFAGELAFYYQVSLYLSTPFRVLACHCQRPLLCPRAVNATEWATLTIEHPKRYPLG